jgi:hypothetical protein
VEAGAAERHLSENPSCLRPFPSDRARLEDVCARKEDAYGSIAALFETATNSRRNRGLQPLESVAGEPRIAIKPTAGVVAVTDVLQIIFSKGKRMTFVKLDFAKDRQDAELTKEIQNRMIKINSYIQHPDPETLLPLLGEDLATRYGQERVFHMADGILWGGNDIDEELS